MEELDKIENYAVSQKIFDLDGCICEISGKTESSIEVSIKKKTEKGINCKQWFEFKNFLKRFKK